MAISVCVLSNNDPENLIRCLTPLTKANEVFVADFKNSDDIKEVAEEFNANFVNTDSSDLNKIKNRLLSLAKSDYVLFLESSNVIFKQDLIKLDNFLGKDDAAAYLFTVRNYSNVENLSNWKPSDQFNGFSGYTAEKKICLWKNNPSVKFSGTLLSTPLKSILDNKLVVKEITDIFIHNLDSPFIGLRNSLLKEHLESHPDDLNVLYMLGTSLIQQGRFDDAKEYFEKIRHIDSKFKNTLFNLANIFFAQDDYYNAGKSYLEVLKLNPKNVAAHRNLGMVFRKSRELEKAVVCFRKAISLSPRDPRLYKILASTYVKLDDIDKAKSALASGYKITNHPSLLKQLKAL